MKKIITAIALSITLLSAQAQVDTTKKLIPPPDSLQFISANDLVEFTKVLKKGISYEDYLKLNPDAVISNLYQWAIAVWNERKKKPKGK